jgi:hypothetical protein
MDFKKEYYFDHIAFEPDPDKSQHVADNEIYVFVSDNAVPEIFYADGVLAVDQHE